MEFNGQIILSFLEEDNTQRAYFRVRPLLTAEGAVGASELEQLPDEGYLRVVPDKNEQHTFKERMRALGSLCVLDLMNLPPEAVKIRSNKNYAPARGENNQFIVYSDAVQAMPSQLFYEVIAAEADEKEKIASAATPLCYLRSGGKMYGPYSRATVLEQEGAAALPPDSDGLYAVSMPDGSERLFYWPRSGAARVSQLDGETAGELAPSAQEGRLSGMPLYQTVARRVNVSPRAHNALADTVERQLRAGRAEAPGAVLSANAAVRQIENPMEAFKRALGALWPLPEMQRQATAHFLSMTGVRHILDQQLAEQGGSAVTAAMNRQIEDLEAERLALLMQLEQGRKDMEALRREALAQTKGEEEETLLRLRKAEESARADLERTNAARQALLSERDAIVAEMAQADAAHLQLAAGVGGDAGLDQLCRRVCEALEARQMVCAHDDAVHLLTLLCLCEGRMAISAPTAADARDAAQALAQALGAAWVYQDDEWRGVCVQEGGDAFRIVISPRAQEPSARYTRLLVQQSGGEAYALSPWPVAYLRAGRGGAEKEAAPCAPVRAEAVREAVLRGGEELSQETVALLDALDDTLERLKAPLPRRTRRSMQAYLRAASAHMEGGVARALDGAFSAWVAPHARQAGIDAAPLRQLAGNLPQTLRLLGR